MKIIDLLNSQQLSLSFEVFPPKTETAFESVKEATEEIAKLKPAFMSVTYGAGGGTSKYTLDIAKNIKELYGVPTLAHLTCVSSTKETVRKKIEQIKAAGITNVMALRGDIPAEFEDADRSGWDYKYAIDLIHEQKSANADFCIGGACYPEIHPESATQKDDIKRLKEKVEADFYEYSLKKGDVILMCTDGLSNMVEEEEIFSIIKGARDIVEAGQNLIKQANANGGRDNIGIVLAMPFSNEVSIW